MDIISGMETELDFNNTSLISRQISTIASRSAKDMNTGLHIGDIGLQLPLIASPMADVSGASLSRTLINNGCYSFIHRFQSEQQQLNAWQNSGAGIKAGCAIGIRDTDRFSMLYGNGCRHFLLDVANGANTIVGNVVAKIKQVHPEIFLMVGNVATKEGFNYLAECGADAVRVNIAAGHACETRITTGIYRPTLACVHECYQHRVKKDCLIIADGGVSSGADFCKCIALGADAVMVGSLLAATKSSPAKTIKHQGHLYKIFRGSSSYSIKLDNQQELKFFEGTEKLLPYSGPTSDLVVSLRESLLSSMSYANAKTLQEYRENIEIIRI